MNRKGHFGKPPPAMKISPQSQIVPSTSPSSMSSIPMLCPSPVTATPEMIDSFLPPRWAVVSPLGLPGCVPLAGSCEIRVLILRSGVPWELRVWTTCLIVMGSAIAGTAVKRKMQSSADDTQHSRAACCGSFLVTSWAQFGFIRFERLVLTSCNRSLVS